MLSELWEPWQPMEISLVSFQNILHHLCFLCSVSPTSILKSANILECVISKNSENRPGQVGCQASDNLVPPCVLWPLPTPNRAYEGHLSIHVDPLLLAILLCPTLSTWRIFKNSSQDCHLSFLNPADGIGTVPIHFCYDS